MTEGQAERSQSAADNLRTAGLDERAISRLGELKRQILSGERSELTQAHKYLLFVKYLLAADQLHDGEPD